VIDYRDWHVPLGRRFRALKLWLVMKHYGLQGLRAFIRGHLQLASELEAWVRADARWEVVAPRTMNLVCIAVASKDGEAITARNERTKAVMDSVNASGAAYCTHTLVPLKGEKVLAIRIAIGATLTQREHVLGVWRAIKEAEQNGGGARS
jgi:aromatic-L-amino-acid decarboxylase